VKRVASKIIRARARKKPEDFFRKNLTKSRAIGTFLKKSPGISRALALQTIIGRSIAFAIRIPPKSLFQEHFIRRQRTLPIAEKGAKVPVARVKSRDFNRRVHGEES